MDGRITLEEWQEASPEEQWKTVQAMDFLLEQRDRLLELFNCPVHGAGCAPFAVEEIKRLQSLDRLSGSDHD